MNKDIEKEFQHHFISQFPKAPFGDMIAFQEWLDTHFIAKKDLEAVIKESDDELVANRDWIEGMPDPEHGRGPGAFHSRVNFLENVKGFILQDLKDKLL